MRKLIIIGDFSPGKGILAFFRALLILGVMFSYGHAQIGNHWAFGVGAGLDFNQSPPKPYSTKIEADWGSTAIAECDGDLLFYSNGKKAWNYQDSVMENGDSLTNLKGTAANVKAVPKPGTNHQYYLFVNNGDLRYSVIDMSKNNQKGQVVLKNKVLRKKTKHLAVTFNGENGYWLVTADTRDTVYAYSITASGIKGPIKSEVKTACDHDQRHNFHFNNAGNKLAVPDVYLGCYGKSPTYSLKIHNFNKKTGKFTNPKGLVLNNHPYKNRFRLTAYPEFSPNDSLLYFWLNEKHNATFEEWDRLIQMNPHATNPRQTKVTLWQKYSPSISPIAFLGLGLAPNDKIYVFQEDDTLMNVIHHPNRQGLAAYYEQNAVNLAPNKTGTSVPSVYFPSSPAQFKTQPQSTCLDTTRFTNRSDSNAFTHFKWYFGDGDSAKGYHAQHAYEDTGTYVVKMAGYDWVCNKPKWHYDTIEVKPPVNKGFVLDSATYSCGQAHLHVSDTSGAPDVAYTVYPKGQQSQAQPWHQARDTVLTVKESGRHTIRQRTHNNFCTESAYRADSVYIADTPETGFYAMDTIGCSPFQAVVKDTAVFDTLHDSTTTWYLANKNGITDTFNGALDSFKIHSFNDSTIHQLTQIAGNTQGCRDTLTKDSLFKVIPPAKAQFSTTIDTLCQAYRLTLKNQSQYADSFRFSFPAKNRVEISNNKSSNLKQVYDNTGEYFPRLTAYNPHCRDSFADTFNLQVRKVTHAGFQLKDSLGCTPAEAVIQPQAQGLMDSITYAFGDGSRKVVLPQDSAVSITHPFPDSGTYRIRQTVHSPRGCTYTDSALYRVTETPNPRITIADSQAICGGYQYVLDDRSQTYDSIRWHFPTDSVNYDLSGNPILRFFDSGQHTVHLENFHGHCRDTASITLQPDVRPKPELKLSLEDSMACLMTRLEVINQSEHVDEGVLHFGDGQSQPLTFEKDTLIHRYEEPGQYDLMLTGRTEEGCRDTLHLPDAVTVVDSVHADFSLSDTFGCQPFESRLENASYAGQYGDTEYTLQWGDQTELTRPELKSVSHTYQHDGKYTVNLQVGNGVCTDTHTQPVRVKSIQPYEQVQWYGATVTDNQKIKLAWHPKAVATAYTITNGEGQYVDRVSDTVFQHRDARPGERPYTYYVQAEDACGNQSDRSLPARTIHLKGNRPDDNAHSTLEWTPYQEWPKGIANYRLKWLQTGQTKTFAPNKAQYRDASYFDTAYHERCYQVIAREQGGDEWQSRSNTLCLPYAPHLWIPTAFSPNDDGLNDQFRFKGFGFEQQELTIYNRWGTEVAHLTNENESWDGTFQGEPAPNGIYLYSFEGVTEEGTPIQREGTFQLLR